MEPLTHVCEIPSTVQSSMSSQSRRTLYPWQRCFAPANGWGLFWYWQDEGQAEVFRESYRKELTQQMDNESNLSVLNPWCLPGDFTPAEFILKRQSLIFSCWTKKVKRAFPQDQQNTVDTPVSCIPVKRSLFFPRFLSVSLFLVSKCVSLFCVCLCSQLNHIKYRCKGAPNRFVIWFIKPNYIQLLRQYLQLVLCDQFPDAVYICSVIRSQYSVNESRGPEM